MIKEAQERLKGVAQKTGLSYSNSVSDLAGCEVYLKLENLQRTGSFKLRGAYNKVASLTPEEREPRPGRGSGCQRIWLPVRHLHAETRSLE